MGFAVLRIVKVCVHLAHVLDRHLLALAPDAFREGNYVVKVVRDVYLQRKRAKEGGGGKGGERWRGRAEIHAYARAGASQKGEPSERARGRARALAARHIYEQANKLSEKTGTETKSLCVVRGRKAQHSAVQRSGGVDVDGGGARSPYAGRTCEAMPDCSIRAAMLTADPNTWKRG